MTAKDIEELFTKAFGIDEVCVYKYDSKTKELDMEFTIDFVEELLNTHNAKLIDTLLNLAHINKELLSDNKTIEEIGSIRFVYENNKLTWYSNQTSFLSSVIATYIDEFFFSNVLIFLKI